MTSSEIPAFVKRVIDAGCDICAIDHFGYVLGDVEEMSAAADELQLIGEEFGDRGFLRNEIVAYLRSIGRYLDVDTTYAHWSQNPKVQ
ncbi:hypothetical protein GA829_05115 [Mesorhizobium sp. INR15]|nr:hypothetical protein GA829_05115 [Mesorhizobium sp. INR15]